MKAKKKIASKRRVGVERSETRQQLIEAAAQIVQEEGFAALTAGRLAEKFGLKRQIVHYYFRTIEDLLIAVMQSDGERARSLLVQILESDEPLKAIWERSHDASARTLEYMALAAHRQTVQGDVRRYTQEFRSMQTRALARYLQLRGIEPDVPPVAMILILQSVAQCLAVEETVGVTDGHQETRAVIEQWLSSFAQHGKLLSPDRRQGRTSGKTKRPPSG
jgi:AcrR family transcriptional regulator